MDNGKLYLFFEIKLVQPIQPGPPAKGSVVIASFPATLLHVDFDFGTST